MARKLVVEIVGSTAGLERSFARASRSTQGFEHDIGRASRGALSAAVSFQGLGRSMAFASAQFLGGAGIVFALKAVVNEASSVQEEVEKTGVVFGRQGAQVQAWSKTLAQSFGIGEGAALKAAGQFGEMFHVLNFSQSAAAAMSKRMITLAADMASFNNASPADTLQALTAGFAGQIRPLRQYGVFLTQAGIQTEAYRDGIAKVGATLTQSQKAQATYNLILKQTVQQQGDVARNTGSLSVAQSKLTAGIQNLEAGLGTLLLPQLTRYVNVAAEWLNQSENQERVIRDVTEAAHDMAAVAQVLGTVVKTAADAFKAFSDVVGGSKHALELLLGVAVGFKALKLVDSLSGIGLAAQTSTGQVNILRTRLLALRTLGVIGVTIAVGFEVAKGAHALDKFLGGTSFGKALGIGEQLVSAADVKKLLAGGASPEEIAAKFGGFLDDSGIDALKKAKDAFAARAAKAAKAASASNLFSGNVPTFATGPAFAPPTPKPGTVKLRPFAQANLDLSTATRSGNVADQLKALNTQHELLAKKIDDETKRLEKAPTAKAAKKFATELERLNGLDAAALSEIDALQKKAAGKTPTDRAAQRNTFFDNAITRALSQVQDLPIGKQVAALTKIAGDITKRLSATKDVTRRLTLEDEINDVLRQRKATVEGIAGDAAALFDSTISRALDRIGDLPIGKQIAQLKKLAGDITKRIAATQDVQRKRTLEDELLGVTRQIGGTNTQLAQNFIDSLALNVTTAEATAGLADDFKTLNALKVGLEKEIAEGNDVADNKAKLADTIQKIAAKKVESGQRILDALSLNVTKAEATATLSDDFATLNALKVGLQKQIGEGLNVSANKAKLAETIQKIATATVQQGQNILEALSFGVTKAEATATLTDDLAALEALKVGYQKQIDTGADVVENKKTLFGIVQQIAAVHRQQGKNILDALSFGVTKAEVTAGLADDLAANAALQAGLKKQIAGSNDAADLERQLFAAQQKERDLRKQGREKARQAVTDRLQLASDRAATTPGLGDDLKARKALVANIRDQIKANGSTIKAQEELLASIGGVKEIRKQIAQATLDALSFGVDTAAVTKSQQDDLKALTAQRAGLEKALAADKGNLAIQQQLLANSQATKAVNRQIAANRNAARNASQFKALGLTGTGADKVPGVKSLTAQLGSISDAVTGSFLDTKKTRSIMTHLKEVLSGGLGVVGREVRDKVKGILDDLDQQLKNHAGDQTKFRHISAANILAGQGLSPEQIRALTPRIAAIGPGGTVPRPTGQFAGAGGGVTITGPIHLHGVQNLREFEETIEKRARSRAASRRGAR